MQAKVQGLVVAEGSGNAVERCAPPANLGHLWDPESAPQVAIYSLGKLLGMDELDDNQIPRRDRLLQDHAHRSRPQRARHWTSWMNDTIHTYKPQNKPCFDTAFH